MPGKNTHQRGIMNQNRKQLIICTLKSFSVSHVLPVRVFFLAQLRLLKCS